MDENIIAVLNNLNQCISVGQSSLGGAMSIGFYDRAAQDNMKKIIINAFKERKMSDEESKALNSTTEASGQTKEELKKIGFSLDKTFKNFQRELGSWEKISDKWAGFMEHLPAVGNVLSGAYRILEWMVKLQLTSVNKFQQLTNAGVALEDSTTHLFKYASDIGITIDDLTKQMTEYSPELAKMRGIFGSGLKSFVDLEQSAKKVSTELGLKFSTSLKISMNYFNSMAESYFVQNRSIEELQAESERYTKTLQKLSIVTGKSAESILSEIEAREKNVKWQMISSDERNKEMITAMTAMGFSQDDIISVITGMMQETTAKSMVNPGQASILNALMQLQRSGQKITGEEILKYSQNAYKSSGVGRYAQNDYLFYKNNPHLAYTMDEDVIRGIINPQRIMEMKNIESYRNDIEKSKQVNSMYEEMYRVWNNFVNMFSVEGGTFNKLLKNIVKTLKYFNEEIFTAERSDIIRKFIDSTFNFMSSLPEKLPILFDAFTSFIKNFKIISIGFLTALATLSAAITYTSLKISASTIGGLFTGKALKNGKNLSKGGKLLAKTGKLAGGAILGLVAGELLDASADYVVDKDFINAKAAYGLSGAGQGAIYGATVGSAFPIIGTAAGAIGGAVIGGVTGLIKGYKIDNEKTQKLNEKQIDEQFSKLTNTTLNIKNEDESKYEDEKKNILISISNDINSMKSNMSSLLSSSIGINNNTYNMNQKLGNISFTREVEYQSV